MYDVLCVGILTADALAKPVEKIPEKGRLELVDKISLFTGGCAVNSAIDLAKLGFSAAIIGKTGADGFGRFLLEELRAAGVDTAAVCVDAACSTSASLVISNADGERSFLHSTGANGRFVEADIDYKAVEKAKLVFVAGSMLMPMFDGPECAKFLQKAHAMGKTTALDTAWDSTGRWMGVLAPCMPHIDYFLPSYEEAVQLSGKTELPEIADAFLTMGPHTVAIKNGRHGCFIKTKAGESWNIPTFERVKPRDTTGAGDSFCAGFLAALSRGRSLPECGRFANAVGTFCVTGVGASTGIVTEAETLRFMEDYDAGRV